MSFSQAVSQTEGDKESGGIPAVAVWVAEDPWLGCCVSAFSKICPCVGTEIKTMFMCVRVSVCPRVCLSGFVLSV